MKKCLFAASLLLTTGAFAQTSPWSTRPEAGPWSFSLSAGAAIPVGKYASALPETGNGDASPGLNLQGQVDYIRANRDWGLRLTGGYRRNQDGWVADKAYYDTWRLMAGPFYRWRIGGPWSLTAGVAAGVERFMPTFAAPKNTAFAWGGGLDLRYRVGRRWFLAAVADLVMATYNSHIEWVGWEPWPPTQLFPSNTINTSLGLGFKI